MGQGYYSQGRKQISFFLFLRDAFISKLPIPPKYVSKFLIPYSPDFIFLTHPRNEDDILATFPFLRAVRKIFPFSLVETILRFAPCYIVSHVNGPKGKKGYVISVVELPEKLFSSRELTQKLIEKCTEFFKKICLKEVYVGLAAWWPIVSNAGQMFNDYLKGNNLIKITNGHTATLASIYLSLRELSKIIGLPLERAEILIIGVGKVGGALAHLLAGQVKKIGLADKNKMRLSVLNRQLEKKDRHLIIENILIEDSYAEEIILKQLERYDISVCTTTNTNLLISQQSKLKNCIILDDSRPEAFPRVLSKDQKVVVLEGGLMKIPGVSLDSDFGFGQDENIFGCLSEAIILALDEEKQVKPNVGELDFDNLNRLIGVCKDLGIQVGDFKCAHRRIQEEELVTIFSTQKQNI